MAWLEKRGNTFHVLFRFGGRRFKGSLRTGAKRSGCGMPMMRPSGPQYVAAAGLSETSPGEFAELFCQTMRRDSALPNLRVPSNLQRIRAPKRCQTRCQHAGRRHRHRRTKKAGNPMSHRISGERRRPDSNRGITDLQSVALGRLATAPK